MRIEGLGVKPICYIKHSCLRLFSNGFRMI